MSVRTISQEIQYLVDDQKVCLIPVGEERTGNDRHPYVKWAGLTMPLDIMDLFDLMMSKDTNTVAMVTGDASGRLICIDVDTKYKPGFDATLFQDLKAFYPNLLEQFRIEQSPSGGYHLLYRVGGTETLPKCPKMASRPATEMEIQNEPKAGKKRCFLEVKGNGGLTHCYPNVKYKLIQDKPIPLLSWEEHCSIFTLCKSYDECIEPEIIKATKAVSDFYSENPFEHYNKSEEGTKILEDFGWKFYGKSGHYNYYTRPGAEGKWVSASFNVKNNLYKIFTAGTELDTKSFTPSLLLQELKYGGGKDRKELFSYLVGKGYGKIHPKRENDIVKRRLLDGAPLPANISEEAKKEYEDKKLIMTESYPFGTFWKISEIGVITISREDIYRVASELGFRNYRGDVCLLKGYLIYDLKENDFYNELKKYIKEDDNDIFNAYESFIQHNGKFTITRIQPLDETTLVRSTKLVSYKFYRNCYIKIEKDSVELIDYSLIEGYIWKKDQKDRDFIEIPKEDISKSIYYDFLNKAIGISPYLLKCIGYYAHDYRDEQGYFITTTEQCENPKNGAGAGKNVFWAMFGEITSFKSIPASLISRDTKLLQSWNGERVLVLSDTPKNFDLIFFKDIISGNAVQKKLYKDEVEIPISEMCKLGGSSNYSYDDSDPGVGRRVRAIEFTNYFTLKGDRALEKEYGKLFPYDWTVEDYLGFDNLMIGAIQEFLLADCKIEKPDLSVGGWSKQFEQKYKHLHEFILQNIDSWVESGSVKNEDFKKTYRIYCEDNSVKSLSAYTQNKAIEDYCLHYGIGFEHGNKVVWRENGILVRGRRFGAAVKEELSVNVEEEITEKTDVPF